MAAFHQKCGDRVILTNNHKTAVRNFSEFNNGIVLSSEPLSDNSLFQVKIEKAVSLIQHFFLTFCFVIINKFFSPLNSHLVVKNAKHKHFFLENTNCLQIFIIVPFG